MVRFDEALAASIEVIKKHLTSPDVTFVRTTGGQITAVLPDGVLDQPACESLASELDNRLGGYSPGSSRVLLRASDLIDEQDILSSPDRVQIADHIWLVDRLLTNQDWLRPAQPLELPFALATFFSLKGGVGRSTALAAAAWHLARKGHRVVVVDLDLEAPGLGSILLGDQPDYGLADWLTETLIGEPELMFLDDCMRFSPLAEDAAGRIEVLPAFGRRTREYIAKVGRIFMPGIDSQGRDLGLTEKLRCLLESLARREEKPDVVLLDARAGLHDIGAAAVTQLGATVFLFARDEPQSWQAYRLLFEHLARSRGVKYGMPDDDLRWRLKMVAAQVEKTEGAVLRSNAASYDVWSELYDDEEEENLNPSAKTFMMSDVDAPHQPLPIYFDDGLRGAAFVHPEQRPPWPVVEGSFGAFFDGVDTLLFFEAETDPSHAHETP